MEKRRKIRKRSRIGSIIEMSTAGRGIQGKLIKRVRNRVSNQRSKKKRGTR